MPQKMKKKNKYYKVAAIAIMEFDMSKLPMMNEMMITGCILSNKKLTHPAHPHRGGFLLM